MISGQALASRGIGAVDYIEPHPDWEPEPVERFTFNDETHEYRILGELVPSVTQVLNSVFPRFAVDPYYLQRGSVIHACCAMLLRREEFDYDPQIEGWIKAAKKFITQVNPVAQVVERQYYSERYGFAGTVDAVVLIGGNLLLLDWKSSTSGNDLMQLAGYSILTNVPHGVIVELNEDGTYTMGKIVRLRQYQAGFLSALSVFKMQKQRE